MGRPKRPAVRTQKEEQIDKLVQLYLSKRDNQIKNWLEDVRGEVQKLMEGDSPRIHYIRWRLKDPQHLREKLRRKWRKYKRDGLGLSNFFNKITDLAGLRILVLYRDDIPLVDEQIRTNDRWIVEESTAYCDEDRQADQIFYQQHGFIRRRYAKPGEPRLETRPRGYSSVHYILRNSRRGRAQPCESCELQLRTIHQEAWGEFDHELKYPRGNVDPLASELIAKLSGLLNLAEDIVREIRRHPSSALIVRHLLSKAWRDNDTTMEGALQQLTSVFFPNSPFLYRAAPIAAFDILKADRTDGPQHRLVSFDFGSSEEWGYPGSLTDPLRELYVAAHTGWKNRSPSGTRSVRKYLLWDRKRALPRKLISGCEGLEFYAVDRALFNSLHQELVKQFPNLLLSRTQFFLWDVPGGSPQPAKLEGDKRVYGFYSPALISDLTGGIVWLNDPQDWHYQRIVSYVSLLDRLADYGLIYDAQSRERPPLSTLNARELISEAIQEAFSRFAQS